MPPKPPERWDEKIIDTPFASLTKRDVYDYYNNPTVRQAIMDAVGNRKAIIRQSFSPGENILRRKAPGGDLITKQHLPDLIGQRLSEVHPTFGKKVNFLMADIDPQEGVSWEKTKRLAKQIAETMGQHEAVKNVQVRFSGGRGFYVQGFMDKSIDINKARALTQKVLSGVAAQPDVTFGQAGKGQTRIDTSTLHNRGSVRAPFSLNAQTGLVSAPVSLDRLPKVKKTDFTIDKVLRVKKAAAQFSIRKMTADDAKKYNIPELQSGAKFRKGYEHLIAFKPSGEFAGFASFEPKRARLQNLWVHPDARRQGLATTLIESFSAKPTSLDVRPDNEAAKALYARLGFTKHHDWKERKDPSEHWTKAAAAAAEFAPGIPASRKIHNIPQIKNKAWQMAIQRHDAEKAGPHWDLRLVDPKSGRAHSFAIPKMIFPEGKKINLAIQQPTHTADYATTFEGDIPAGTYGAGTVKMHTNEPINVIKANANRIQFEREGGDRFMLFRMRDKNWGIRKLT